jgi:hypothetical protein
LFLSTRQKPFRVARDVDVETLEDRSILIDGRGQVCRARCFGLLLDLPPAEKRVVGAGIKEGVGTERSAIEPLLEVDLDLQDEPLSEGFVGVAGLLATVVPGDAEGAAMKKDHLTPAAAV